MSFPGMSLPIQTTSQEEKNEIEETFSRIPGIFGYKSEQVKVLGKIIVEKGGYEVVRKIRSKKGAKKEKAGTGEEKGKGGKGGVKRSSAKSANGSTEEAAASPGEDKSTGGKTGGKGSASKGPAEEMVKYLAGERIWDSALTEWSRPPVLR